MFPTATWAKAYILGLAVFYGLFPLTMFTDSPWIVAPIFLSTGPVFVSLARLAGRHRSPPATLLVDYLAFINLPAQVLSAARVATWRPLRTGAVIGALLLVDLAVLVVVTGSRLAR